MKRQSHLASLLGQHRRTSATPQYSRGHQGRYPVDARLRWLLPFGIAATAAVGVATQPLLAMGLGTLFLVVWRKAWIAIAWTLLAGLMVLGYGFNNITVPGMTLPLVDALLVLGLALSFPTWRELWSFRIGRRILALLGALSAVAAIRLSLDLPLYGLTAARDALYVLEAWGVALGFAVGRTLRASEVERNLGLIYRTAFLWFMFYPLRFSLATLGPVVGIQRPVPLLDFTTTGVVSAVGIFWFLQDKRQYAGVFAAAGVVALLFGQGRGPYLAVILTLVIVVVTSRGEKNHAKLLFRASAWIAAAFIIVAVLPLPRGRLGARVGFDTMASQLLTLTGAEGPGSGSFRWRLEVWRELPAQVDTVPKVLVGVGYGPDLIGGFTVNGGVLVRKPHNDLLEVWARTGIVGLVPWFGLVLTLMVAGFRGRGDRRFGWWLIALQVTTVVVALTQPMFSFAYGGLVYSLLMGIYIGLRRKSAVGIVGSAREVVLD